MKKLLTTALALLTTGCLWAGKPIFADRFDKAKTFARNWQADAPENRGTVAYAPGEGVGGSGCVAIASTEKSATTARHELTGLEPGKLYRFSAKMRCEGVEEGRGAVLFVEPEGMEQSWNASEFTYGTCDWKEVYMDFVAGLDGRVTLCCGLGFPWGTYNGGKARGKVWYDDVRVAPVDDLADNIYSREGRYIVLKLDRDKVTITDAQADAWLANLDRIYEAYRDLVGDVPYEGRKIVLLNTPGIEPGYWALAGNPILWNNHVAVKEVIERTQTHDDWGFGIMHEIGHVFSSGTIRGNSRWNWNDEIFANFRMSYALEVCYGTMSQRDKLYKGADVIDYYKIFYDETIGAGIAKNNGDALHYTFLRIKEKYGWDVYKKAFRKLYDLKDSELNHLHTDFQKMMFFLGCVSEAAGEDVVAATYTPEELRLIEESLKR